MRTRPSGRCSTRSCAIGGWHNVRLVAAAAIGRGYARSCTASGNRRNAAALGQFTRLRDLIRETLKRAATSSAVLCGDFNSPGGIQSGAPLRSIMRDAWPEGGRGWGATMPSWLPLSRIDQCWVTPDIEVVSAVVRKGDSDHRRLVVDLRFR